MAKDLYYYVKIRKPLPLPQTVIFFDVDSFRFGSLTETDPDWKYEIPFSEIVQIEYKSSVMRGSLRDGTEFDFKILSQMNPMKDLRSAQAMQQALQRIEVWGDGSSVRTVGASDQESATDDRPPGSVQGSGCFGSVVAMVVMVAVPLGVWGFESVIRTRSHT